MATTFEQIYERAVFKITDYSFLTIEQDVKEGVLLRYLLSAITDFKYACTKTDITDYDIEAQCFNVDLDDEQIEILSLGIAYYWLSAKALNSQLLKNIIHSSDYTSYSPANLLNQVQALRDSVGAEYRGKINTYSYRYGSIATLKT